MTWWQQATFYQIYPRSFADANGDGVGDLAGIRARLPYLRDLGVQALWISPFFASPQRDFGYDIADYLAVAPEYGNLADVQALIADCHAHGLRVVFDLVLNHTSDQHPWFTESRSSPQSPRRHWYIWSPRRNNWRSMTGGSGWQRDPTSGQYYWASFLPFQPDLNWRNPEVRQAMFDMIRHWLAAGVDGFRLDIFNAIYKDANLRPNPWAWQLLPSEHNPIGFFQNPVHSLNHPDSVALAQDLHRLLDEYSDNGQRPRMTVGEVFGPDDTIKKYLGTPQAPGLSLVFAFKTLTVGHRAPALRRLVQEQEATFAAPHLPVYVFSNHDRVRSITLLGGRADRARLRAVFQLTVRGVPFIYYGDEIGLAQHRLPLATGLDPIARQWRWVPGWVQGILRRRSLSLNRDECRTPMPWTPDAPHAGFCPPHVQPWLPLQPDYPRTNVATQQAEPSSLWHLYRTLLHLRAATPALHAGSLTLHADCGPPAQLLAYRRTAPLPSGTPQHVDVYLNASDRPGTVRPIAPGRLLAASHADAPTHVQAGQAHALRPHEAWVVEVKNEKL